MAVARISEIERQPAEVTLALLEPFERQPQSQLVAIPMQRLSGSAAKRSAQVEDRAVDRASDASQRQPLGDSRRHEQLRGIGQITRAATVPPRRPPWRGIIVGMVEDAVEQGHDPLFDVQWIDRTVVTVPRDLHEQTALVVVGAGVGQRVREANRSIVLRRRRVVRCQRVAQDLVGDAVPVAAIALAADGPPFVGLLPVVKRDDGGIGNKWSGALSRDRPNARHRRHG